jgi:hypothetical protein
MTPDEAKTKWCPFSRVALTAGIAANRTAAMGKGGYADLTDETRCIAAECMAWRWWMLPLSKDQFDAMSPAERQSIAHSNQVFGPGDGTCGLVR